MRDDRLRRLVCLLCCAALPSLVGCGVGEYESRMQRTERELKYLEPFIVLNKKPVTIGDTGVEFRLPEIMEQRFYSEMSIDPESGVGAIARDRLEPPFMHLPGTLVVYECFATLSGGEGKQLPAELHIAVDRDAVVEGEIPAESLPAADAVPLTERLKQEIVASLGAETLEGQNLEWQTVELATPDAKHPEVKIPWKRLSFTAPQWFSIVLGYRTGDIPGKVDVYVYETSDLRIIMVWRVPTEIADVVPADVWAPLVAGSLVTPQ